MAKKFIEDKARSKKIYELRRQGKTYKSIGEFFSITPNRARQIYEREKWRKENKNRLAE